MRYSGFFMITKEMEEESSNLKKRIADLKIRVEDDIKSKYGLSQEDIAKGEWTVDNESFENRTLYTFVIKDYEYPIVHFGKREG